MGCGAGRVGPGQVAPADGTDTSPSSSSGPSGPELERHADRSDRSPWGKLMVGFLMAKLDRLVQEALAGLKQDDCELFAHHIDREFSEEHLRVHRHFLSSLEQLLEASLGGLGMGLSEVAELLHQEAERETEARRLERYISGNILQQLLLYTELHDFARVMRQRSWGRVSEVRVYWDIQNVGGEVMEGTLMTFLKDNYMLSGNVDMWAVAPSHYYARKQTMVRDLNEFGITVVHCSDKAENADHLIKHRIEKDLTLMEKLQLPPRETAFILITSDKDFMDILRKLFFNGHKTVLIHDAKKGEKKSEHEEKVTFFSTESFVFSDIVKWELVHQRNAWQSLMAWAGSMVQPGVRIKHLKEKVEEPGRAKWRCTLEVEFDRRNRLFLSEGVHQDNYKSGEEAAKNAIKRLRDLFGPQAEEELIEKQQLESVLKQR